MFMLKLLRKRPRLHTSFDIFRYVSTRSGSCLRDHFELGGLASSPTHAKCVQSQDQTFTKFPTSFNAQSGSESLNSGKLNTNLDVSFRCIILRSRGWCQTQSQSCGMGLWCLCCIAGELSQFKGWVAWLTLRWLKSAWLDYWVKFLRN